MKNIRRIAFIAMISLLPILSMTQPNPTLNGDGSKPGSTPVPGSSSGAPIDGGTGILLILGAAYAFKKVKKTGH